MNELDKVKNEILIYQDEENIKVEVFYEDENVWLTQNQMAKLFETTQQNISLHIKNIFDEEELKEFSVHKKFLYTAADGKKYNTSYYNLDMIISVGYRIKSKVAVKFRQWATKIIKDYMIQGFALDDDRFMKARKGDQEYFKRLLERIKLIRTSERMFYQKITDIFAECSIDYDKTSETAKVFYATIQNKFHYAITGETAAEIILHRASSKKDNMGLTNWQKSPDGKILKSDVMIAKNYLQEKELDFLKDIVTMYLDIAENRAKRQITMKMKEWVEELDMMLKSNRYEVLKKKGRISNEEAQKFAESEYDKYRVIQDKKYISEFDKIIEVMKKKND